MSFLSEKLSTKGPIWWLRLKGRTECYPAFDLGADLQGRVPVNQLDNSDGFGSPYIGAYVNNHR